MDEKIVLKLGVYREEIQPRVPVQDITFSYEPWSGTCQANVISKRRGI